ncbi:MAG: alanine/ornithine racemase family PLP-dependent enzyme [Treponema sp.]|jgi:predicted amino acid racemase|nr:alanine/ornithine racemase family PLP-dependent enzyme [Treponema sp.]
MYPSLSIDIEKLRKNLDALCAAVKGAGCSLMIVTKSFCADDGIVDMLLSHPSVDYLADSRIQNIKTYAGKGKSTVLLRLPQECEIPEVVRHADISLNSEIRTLGLLNEEAARQGKTHRVVLMIDLGDLREGIYFEDEGKIFAAVEAILKMKNLEFYGLGTNLTCYGGVIPKADNLSLLTAWADRIHERFGLKSAMVSGGNSSSYYLIGRGGLPEGINNLRLGEAFILGNETAWGSRIENTFADGVILEAQVIEVQTKRSLPVGELGVDAFGQKKTFEDRGIIKRAILAVGRQDVDTENIAPEDPGVTILGSSSDHLMLDISDSAADYRAGDVLRFTLKYGALLRAFTGAYVSRRHIKSSTKK